MTGEKAKAEKDILLSLRGLKTHFPVKKGIFRRTAAQVRAVDGVDLDVYRGEILGLVGESGCGKTTLGKSILRLVRATEGQVLYRFGREFKDLCSLDREHRDLAHRKLQIVFQDPQSSMNPAFTVFGSLEEPLKKFHIGKDKKDRRAIIGDLLERVGMRKEALDRYPNEFSGGQRQRIGIARALSVGPEFVVCDEPVSALDVSIQAQVLNLLRSLKEERQLTYLFISHDLSVVEYISDRIAVMYLGKIVELAQAEVLYSRALHPYTQALFSAIPVCGPGSFGKRRRIVLEGDVPNPICPPPGCPFHPRCPEKTHRCEEETPELKDYSSGGAPHKAACHLLDR